MNTVEPIRDRAKIEKMKTWLLEKSEANPWRRKRNRFLFVFGINTGLRISDILELRAGDVSCTHIILKEKKTGKERRHLINSQLREEIAVYTAGMNPDEFLFPSRKGGHLSRVQAYKILSKAAAFSGAGAEVGTHTLRKTFGYHHYQTFHDAAALQQIFNHSSPSVTLRYIGISQDELDDMAKNFYL